MYEVLRIIILGLSQGGLSLLQTDVVANRKF
jgi:hypothetical protein